MTKPALHVETQYRSRLEEKIAAQLEAEGIPFEYEGFKIEYEVPSRKAKYIPDFPVASRSIILEGKGYFDAEDRKKLINLRLSHPNIDVRLVFARASNKLHKKSPTTYGKWCDDHGFKWSDKGTVPPEWVEEIKQLNRKSKRK